MKLEVRKMELKPNMYVRTKYGITQFKEYETSKGKLLCMPLKNGTFANIEDVLKTSYDILDLIRVGDYVNGYKINAIYDDDSEVNEYNLKHKKCLGKNIYDEDYQEYLIYEEEIETIVTKEQFEAMVYKVVE